VSHLSARLGVSRPLTRLLAATAVAAACLSGCGLSGGAAHADVILVLNNASPTAVMVRWSGTSSGSVSVGHCGGTRQGLDAGDYTIVIGEPPRATFPLHVDFADLSAERAIVIGADGHIVTDAKPDTSVQPCRSPSVPAS
jgi:hypothetical protein